MVRARTERVRLGLSGLETARRAKIAPATLSQIEHGRFRPYDGQLLRLADALGWTGKPEALLEEVDDA